MGVSGRGGRWRIGRWLSISRVVNDPFGNRIALVELAI
jgi:hypothetical protein